MVCLAMTAAIVAAIESCKDHGLQDALDTKSSTDPPLDEPALDKPVSHGQLIDISYALKKHYLEAGEGLNQIPCRLDELLRGSQVYIPPLPPKKQQV
jgi:TMEM199 family protein